MFDKKRVKLLIKILIIILCIVGAFIFVFNSIAKYESSLLMNTDIELAIYLLDEDYQTMHLNLDTLVPRANPYIYNFTIANNDGTNRTETDLEYDLDIKTTTNLPLTYELYLNQNYNDPLATDAILTNTVDADADGTYFRHITVDKENFGHSSNESNEYSLVIYFPAQYNTVSYQDILEMIEINVNSRQVIDE